MIRTLIFLLLLLPFAVKAQQLTAKIDRAQFVTSKGEPYVEIYMQVPPGEAQLSPGLIWLRASFSFEVIVSRNDSVAFFDRYNLNIKGIDSAGAGAFKITEVIRFPLRPGEYLLEVNITDSLSQKSFSFSDKLTVKNPAKSLLFSDVILADSIYPSTGNSKYDHYSYGILPNPARHFTSGNNLYFYAELYNADIRLPDDSFISINYFVRQGQKKLDHTERQRKAVPQSLNIITSIVPLTGFAAGEYTLHLQALTGSGRIVMVTQTPFTVGKPPVKPAVQEKEAMNVPDLMEMKALAYLWQPYADKEDRKKFTNYIEENNEEAALKWLKDHWEKTLAAEKQAGWNEYLERLRTVNRMLSSQIREGYLTDQGRIYFTYGAPNQAQQFPDDPAAYPYEIWEYYVLENQRNITFIFYNPTRLENEYVLLHSNARGEFRNPNWRKVVYQRTNKNNNIDDPRVRSIYGGNRGM